MRPPTLPELCEEVQDAIARAASTGDLAEAEFDRLARRIFAYQYEHNPPYRAFCDRRRHAPDGAGDWRSIPAVVTSAFKSLDLTVLPEGERSAVFYSSGTTRHERSRHFHSPATLKVYEASLLAGFERWMRPDRAQLQLLSLTPSGTAARNSSLVHMLETLGQAVAAPAVFLGRAGADGAWNIDYAELTRIRNSFDSATPLVVAGTAFSFVHLCDHLAERGENWPLPPGSRVFETGGYKGRSRTVPPAELRAMIRERLGVPDTHLLTEYGMSELSSQAYDRAVGESGPRRLRFPPWARWEILSPETGQPAPPGEAGLLRVFDLANAGSVLAIQTEDLARPAEDGFVLLGRAEGAAARGCSLMPR